MSITPNKHFLRRSSTRPGSRLLGASLLALLGALPVFAQSASGPAILSTRQISSGTLVKVQLVQAVNSGTARVGDTVEARVASDDKSGLPAGTTFLGRVTDVRPATSKNAGVLDVQFGIPGQSANGQTYGSATYNNAPISNTDNSNSPVTAFSNAASLHLTGQGAKSDKSQYTSIGAGAGALLGFVRKRKLGDAISGAVVGAAGGYAANAAQKHAGTDVNLLKGAGLSLHTNTPLQLRTEIIAPY